MKRILSMFLCATMIASVFALLGTGTTTGEPGGTYYIQDDATGGDCTSIGDWDLPTKTCTLTTDVYESIQIISNGITLDGDGHQVVRGSGSHGIFVSFKAGVSIRNIQVVGFNWGIYLSSSSSLTLTGNTVLGSSQGIHLYYSSSSTLTGNMVSGGSRGIDLYYSSGNTIAGNTVTGADIGIYISNSDSNTLTESLVTGCGRGILFDSSGGNTLMNNVMNGNTRNFGVYGSLLSHYVQDIDVSNAVNGKPIYYWISRSYETVPADAGYVGIINSDHITLQDLTLTNNPHAVLFAYTTDSTIQNVVASGQIGILLHYSTGNMLIDNTVTGSSTGIDLSYSSGNIIIGNTVAGGSYGISLYSSGGSTLSGNAVTSEYRAIYLAYSGGSTLTENTITGNFGVGIYLYSSTGTTLTGNTVIGYYGYGINLYYSGSSTLAGNAITVTVYGCGVQLYRSGGNTLRDNAIEGSHCNFIVVGSSLLEYIQDIDVSNTVDGKPVYYWVGHSYETVPLDAGYVGVVNSDHITVQDLTLSNNAHGVLFAYTTDSTIQNVAALGHRGPSTYYGIYLTFSTGNTLIGNTVTGNFYVGDYGIFLYGSTGNTLIGNTVKGDMAYGNYGIRLSSSTGNILTGNTVIGTGYYGFYLSSSTGNILIGNTVMGIYDYGIYLSSTTSSMLTGNTVSVASYGIYLSSSSGNMINRNMVSGNYRGFYLSNSNGNSFYHNSIIDNTFQLTSISSSNAWDDGDGNGNYWSDYAGKDLNGDGIGDTLLPHQTVDWYPLMEPWNPKYEIRELIEDVKDMGLPKGVEDSLVYLLKAAIVSLERGDINAAINQLQAFINLVEAYRGKKLTNEQADYMHTEAQRIIDELSG